MDQELSLKIFEKLDDCSQAAEQLAKTIVKFDAAGEKLQKSVSEIKTIDNLLKEENSFQVMLKATGEINQLLKP